MAEGRDLRNKVCYIDGHAYAVGGLNSKAEKFNYEKKTWTTMTEYPLSDNLDSWACAMVFTPQEYAQSSATINQNIISNKIARKRDSITNGLQADTSTATAAAV
eukprot:CAMPEP_0116889254 /NCGR_PEP_ID=MMETSP0463-20121206/24648_1 /TAXON_ID=181622 /ORGANISM="Strombidinopsis sp, Strain SopsisLIS2011" /LENGTH=103 /DNA_ID=CAMNT_0004555579 /DNA_START=1499 /DNA_END=1810 /DNA_ORIENTATION=+